MTGSVRPTLEVVAARAGVSRATASRVLRGASNVSADAKASVERAAAELAYSPNLAARSLVTRRSDSVAFLVAETEDRLFRDPYFMNLLRGAHAEISSAGLQLIFVMAADDTQWRQFENYAAGGHVDGVLLVSLHGDARLPQHLESIGVPTIMNGRPVSPDADELFFVDSDNVGGAAAATELLISRGATRIATVTGPLDMSAGRDRLAGYEQAMAGAGRRVLRKHIVNGDFTVDGGARAMRRLLIADPAIDAVFAASDLTAVGAMQAISDSGRVVPDDVAVVGFDDVQDQLIRPALTTVRQPIEQVGRVMARLLLRRIDGEVPERVSVVPVELVVRETA